MHLPTHLLSTSDDKCCSTFSRTQEQEYTEEEYKTGLCMYCSHHGAFILFIHRFYHAMFVEDGQSHAIWLLNIDMKIWCGFKNKPFVQISAGKIFIPQQGIDKSSQSLKNAVHVTLVLSRRVIRGFSFHCLQRHHFLDNSIWIASTKHT